MNKEVKKTYLYKGVTAFLVVAASILFFFMVYRFDIVLSGIRTVIKVLSPVIFGLIISYLLNPIVDFLNFVLFPKVFKTDKNKVKPFVNLISVCLSLLFFLAIIVGIVVLIIPALIESVTNVVDIIPVKIDNLINWGENFLKENKNVEIAFKNILVAEKEWLKNDFAQYLAKAAEYFASGLFSVINFIKNFAIGFMIAIYLLYNKVRFGNKSRKVLYALFKEKTVKRILKGLHKTNVVFSGFIYGKLLDSFIIGILCFIGVAILKIPYAVLIAVIVGVTNIIPVFGPYIGAIPCAALVLVTEPIKGLYFIVFIILLQTLDGNVIGPKILGDKTGLETFWVIFAIIVGGGLFGIVGMIIGVPFFAIVYYFASIVLNDRLKKKNLSVNSSEYSANKFVDTEIAEENSDA